MATLPIIANVWRVTLNWDRQQGVMPRNVLHFSAPSGTASNFSTSWNTAKTAAGAHLWDAVQVAYSLSSADLLPLDGTTPTTSAAITAEFGQSTGAIVPQVAVVLSLKTGQRGSRGRGRIYMGPPGEDFIANGVIGSTPATNIVTAWASFISSMTSNGWTLGVASYKHADFHPVTSIRCDTTLGTQRNRQEQLEP